MSAILTDFEVDDFRAAAAAIIARAFDPLEQRYRRPVVFEAASNHSIYLPWHVLCDAAFGWSLQ